MASCRDAVSSRQVHTCTCIVRDLRKHTEGESIFLSAEYSNEWTLRISFTIGITERFTVRDHTTHLRPSPQSFLTMTVLKVGDTLPAGQLEYFDGDNKRTVNVEEWGKGKKIILVGIPGAFTPTCRFVNLGRNVRYGGRPKV